MSRAFGNPASIEKLGRTGDDGTAEADMLRIESEKIEVTDISLKLNGHFR
jgi:hypothetical protein